LINTSSSYKALSNREKGKILESLVSEAINELGYHHYDNVPSGKRDIDHLIVDNANKLLYIIESKNLNSDFRLYIGWFKTHVIERFQHLPKIVSNYLERGYQVKRVLIISRFTVADEAVHNLIKKYGIVVIEVGKQLLKQSKKWASLIKIKLKCLLKLNSNFKLRSVINNYSKELDSYDHELGSKTDNGSFRNFMVNDGLKIKEDSYSIGFKFSNYLSRFYSKIHSILNHVKDSYYLSKIKEFIKLFISNTQANITLLDFLPEIGKENDTIQNSENQIKSKKKDSYYPDDEESEQPIWLRSLKEIVNDTENYPRRWARYIYPLRKAQKLVNSENMNEWNELVNSYSKQYSKHPIRRIAQKIYDTHLQYERYLNDYLNTLKRFDNNHPDYQSLIFDSTAKLKGLAIALEKRMLRRYWKLYREYR